MNEIHLPIHQIEDISLKESEINNKKEIILLHNFEKKELIEESNGNNKEDKSGIFVILEGNIILFIDN